MIWEFNTQAMGLLSEMLPFLDRQALLLSSLPMALGETCSPHELGDGS